MIFYINHFSLIIFYHSVWWGFELFGPLKFRCIVIGCSFTLARKGYDNHHCHNKPPDRKLGWNVDDVMPRRDVPDNLRILKRRQLRWDSWGIELGLLPLRYVVKFCRSLPTEILNPTRYAARWGWGQHSKNCASLLVSKNRSQKLINGSYLKQQSPPVFVFCICICICICINIMVVVYNNL